MRLMLAAALVAASAVPAAAQNELPEGIDELMTCRHAYSMRSADAQEAGDEATATELFNMSDALYWQARAVLESAGYSADEIDNVDMNYALVTGFSYGAGMGEDMLAECLAAWDSP
jgi:hypothetical protein